MTDLERLKAELERQDHALEACFERMRGLDPELRIAVAPALLEELEGHTEEAAIPAAWTLRA